MKLSRAALLLSTLVFIGALTWVAVTAGDQVPAHFDGSGQVDRMDSKQLLTEATSKNLVASDSTSRVVSIEVDSAQNFLSLFLPIR